MQKFKNFYTNVTQKVSSTFNQLKQINLNPLNIFIKDSLDKIFNDLTLGHQIKLQDIRKGQLSLQNLLLNTQKINKQHLFSSPYILHSGNLSSIKISLPSLKQLESTSFALEMDGIFLQFKSQSNFQQNFKNIIELLKQYVRLNGNQDEDNQEEQMAYEHDPRDYFKKLIKNMFRNLKVTLKNIVILVYLEDPQKTIQKKEKSSIMMLRIPFINVHRGGQIQFGEQANDHKIDIVNFQINLPQFTLHLLYQQIQKKDKNFTLFQSSINHPGTILLFGQQKFIESEIQKDEQIPRVQIQRKANYQKGEIDFNLIMNAPKIALIINPEQVKIILLFVAQIKHFSQLLQKVKKELGIGQINQKQSEISAPLLLSRRSSTRKANEDLFGSVCMSFWESGVFIVGQSHNRSKRRSHDMIDSIIDERVELKAQVQQLNREIQKSLYHSIEHVSENEEVQERHVVAITFKTYYSIDIQLGLIQLYVIKHLGSEHQQRSWSLNGKNVSQREIQTCMKQSYFDISLSKTYFSLRQRENQMSFELSQVLLRHIKCRKIEQANRKEQNIHQTMTQNKQYANLHTQSLMQQFYDVQNSMDYNLQKQLQSKNQTMSKQKVNEQIKGQKIQQKQAFHHCGENILWISHRKTQDNGKKSQQMRPFQNKILSFHSPQSHKKDYMQDIIHTYESGILIKKKQTQKETKFTIKILHVELSISTQLAIQILSFSSIVKSMLSTQPNPQTQKNQEQDNKESQKNEANKKQAQPQNNKEQKQSHNPKSLTKSNPFSYQLTTKSVSVTFYESDVQNFKSSTQKYQLNQFSQSQKENCFCFINKSKALNLYVRQIRLKQEISSLEMTIESINLNLFEISNSSISHSHNLLQIGQFVDFENNKKQKLKLLYQKSKKQKAESFRLLLKIPQVQLRIKNHLLTSLQFLNQQFEIFRPYIDKVLHQPSTKLSLSNKSQRKNLIINPNSDQHPQNNIQIKCSSLKIQFIDLSLYLQNVFLQKRNQQLLIHLSTIVLYSLIKTKTFQTVMNEKATPSFIKLKKYQDQKNQNRYYGVDNASILLQINNPQYCPKTVQNSKKNMKKYKQASSSLISDQIVLERKSCLLFKTKTQRKNNHNNSKKIISLSFSSNIFMNAANCLSTYNKFKVYQQFIKKAKKLLDGLEQNISFPSQSLQGIKNKDKEIQAELQNKSQEYNQQITLTGGKLFIDVHPTFAQKLPKEKIKKQGQFDYSIFSKSRSIIKIEWQDFKVKNFTQNSQVYIDVCFDIQYYFLKSQSNIHGSVQKNGIYLPIAQKIDGSQKILEDENRFRKILEFKEIVVKIQKISHLVRPNINVKDVKIETTLQTLSELLLHWQHFTKHNFNQTYGMTIDESQNIVQELKWDQHSQIKPDQDNEDSEIQDLTDGVSIYSQKLKYKNEIQQHFKSNKKKPFTEPQIDNKCQIFIQNLSIEQSSIKIYESKLAHLQTYIQGVKIVSKINQQDQKIETLLQIQQFEVNHLKKQQQSEGFFGLVANLWSKKQDQCFSIFKSHNTIKLLIEIDQKNIMIKADRTNLDIGFTSDLLHAIDRWDQINQHINHSGWKKIYSEKNHKQRISQNKETQIEIQQNSQKVDKLLLIYAPQTQISLNLVYGVINISKNLYAPQFLIHQQTHQTDKIKNLIVNWVQKLIKNNIVGLITASALDSFGQLLKNILRIVKNIVSMLLKCLS